MAQDVLHSQPDRAATPATRRNRDFARPSEAPRPEIAVSAVIDLFDSYRVVALSDLHGCAELLAFVDQLLRGPEFRSKVNDITWEPGNVWFQDVMDDFILRGREMPYKELAQCWRNNTQSHTYSDTPALYELLRSIRSVNLRQPESRRLRVLLIDPPIDWSRIQSAEDFRLQDFDRETHMVKVLDREVYAKGRKALFFAGGVHLGRGGGPLHDLEQSHPGTTFNIAIHEGFGDRTEELESRLFTWPKPALARIRGTWWGELHPPPSDDIFIGPDEKRVHPRQDQKIQDKWDAVLFLGKRKELTRVDPPGPNVLDDEWMAELRRRKALRGGPMIDLTTKNRPHTRQFFADDGPHREQLIRLPLGKEFPSKPGSVQPRSRNLK
jgi:hypothetical protein